MSAAAPYFIAVWRRPPEPQFERRHAFPSCPPPAACRMMRRRVMSSADFMLPRLRAAAPRLLF